MNTFYFKLVWSRTENFKRCSHEFNQVRSIQTEAPPSMTTTFLQAFSLLIPIRLQRKSGRSVGFSSFSFTFNGARNQEARRLFVASTSTASHGPVTWNSAGSSASIWKNACTAIRTIQTGLSLFLISEREKTVCEPVEWLNEV